MKRIAAGILVISACGLVACGSKDSANETTSSTDTEQVVLRVGVTTEHTMTMLRKSTTTFDNAPYEIDWVEFDSSSEVLEALSAGAIDFAGMLQPPGVVIAQGNAKTTWDSASAPLKIVSAWEGPESPGFALMVGEGLGSSRSDLSGRKIAVSRGSLGHFYWLEVQLAEGIDGVELVFMPPTESRSAFQSGAVDALITSHRAASAMERKGEGTIIDTSSRVVVTSNLSIASSKVFDSEQLVAAIDDFLRRMEDGLERVRQDPSLAVPFYMETFEFSEEEARQFIQREDMFRVPMDEEVVTLLEKFSRVYFESAVTTSLTDPDVIIDRRFDEGVTRQQ